MCLALVSMGFPTQKYLKLPFPSLGDLPDTEVEPKSPVLAGGFCTTEPAGKPGLKHIIYNWPIWCLQPGL